MQVPDAQGLGVPGLAFTYGGLVGNKGIFFIGIIFPCALLTHQ